MKISPKPALAVVAVAAVALVGGFSASTALAENGKPRPTYGVGSGPIEYKHNAAGQSYGSAARASNRAEEPDLIAVELSGGRTGYVYSDELAEAGGDNADTLEEVQARMAQPDYGKPKSIRAYASDGKTPIGWFTLG